jgi:hypothetical protein
MERFAPEHEVREKVRRWDDIEQGVNRTEKATPKKVDPSLCPVCKSELLWEVRRIPNGH